MELSDEEKKKRRERKNELTKEFNEVLNFNNPTNFFIKSDERNGYWKTAPTLYWNSIEIKEKEKYKIEEKLNIEIDGTVYILALPYHAQLGIKIPENNVIELEKSENPPKTTQKNERLMEDNNEIAVDIKTGNIHPLYAKEKKFLNGKSEICQFVLAIKRGNNEPSPTAYKDKAKKNLDNYYTYKSEKKTLVHKKFFYPELNIEIGEAKEKMKDKEKAFNEFLKQIGLINK